MARIYASELMDKIKNNHPTENSISLVEKSKGTIWGAGIGIAGGLLYAKFNNKNYATCTIIGLIIGGTVSQIFI